MNMRKFQNALRGLILAGSIAGFVGGWGALAHAGKPVDPNPPAQVAPVVPDNTGAGPFSSPFEGRHRRSQSLQPFSSPFGSQSSGGFVPRLRTGGS